MNKVTLSVAAYLPAGESHPILQAVAVEPGKHPVAVGIVFRRGEIGYDLLRQACDDKPIWLFNTNPQPLS